MLSLARQTELSAVREPYIEQTNRRPDLSRRAFLKTGALATAGLVSGVVAHGTAQAKQDATAPRIAIVGAGLSGLVAAYQLKKAGYRANVYEAEVRIGGRVFSVPNLMAYGIVSELGGEFIDTTHTDLLGLVREFGLELIDRQAETRALGFTDRFIFRGQTHTTRQVADALAPFLARMKPDSDRVAAADNYRDDPELVALDRLSVAEYLERLKVEGWLRNLLDVMYVTEFGLETGEQSALNLIDLPSMITDKNTVELFGESDERYKVQGGNQRITDTLVERLEGQIELSRRLEAISENGSGYRLTFESAGGSAKEVDADFVILSLPFSVLRNVSLRVTLPPVTQQAIDELGYGTNAKLLLGFERRVWRDSKASGVVFTDLPFQTTWDHGIGQRVNAGGLTVFTGGKGGLAMGQGSAVSQASRLLPSIEVALPGAREAWNGLVRRAQWPDMPFTRGSYACYKPGQLSAFSGVATRPVGRLFFAGEHCSEDFQGYMNGAAETGRRAAEGILAAL